MRSSTIHRKTKETDITVSWTLDGDAAFSGGTGIPFLDHMLELLAIHSGTNLVVEMKGDLEVDNHHSVEDLALVMGEVLATALGDKKGIARYGSFYCPMDETLVRVVLDFSGRPYLVYDVPLTVERIGTFETEMLKEFLYAFAMKAKCNLHVACLYGDNNHHKVEAVFKALGHAIAIGAAKTGKGAVLSTKGVL